MSQGCLKPDKAVWSAADIYEKYGTFIRKVIGVHVDNPARGDDIFQDFFLSLVAAPPPADVEYVESYLYKAVHNCIANENRHQSRYEAAKDEYAGQMRQTATHEKPEAHVINADEARKMFGLIKEILPDNRGTALIRRYKDGYEIEEVAQKMGVDSIAAVRYIKRGLNRIRKTLTTGESGDA